MKNVLCLATAFALGSGSLLAIQHSYNSQKVTLDQLPPAAKQAIQTRAGGAPIQDIDMETFDGFTTYQAAFNKGGKHQELRVDAQGLPRTEQWRVIPPQVEKTLDKRIGQKKVIAFGKYGHGGQLYYHYRYENNGAPAELWVNQSGQIIQKPEGVTITESAGANAGTAGQTIANQATATTDSATTAAGGTWVEFKDLPWTVQQTIMNQAGGVNVPRVYKSNRDGQVIYHARFDKNGQPTRISVRQDGTLAHTSAQPDASLGANGNQSTATTPLSGGTKVSFNDLPQQVKNAVNAQANGAAIEDVDKGTVNGQTVYEAAFKKEGRTYELQVKEDGTVLGGHFD